MRKKCYGVPRQGKDVCFDGSFTLHIPYGYVYYALSEDEIVFVQGDGGNKPDDNGLCGYILHPSELPKNYSENLMYIDEEVDGSYYKIRKMASLDLDEEKRKELMSSLLDGTLKEAATRSEDEERKSDGIELYRDEYCRVVRYHHHYKNKDVENLGGGLMRVSEQQVEVYSVYAVVGGNIYFSMDLEYGFGIFKVDDNGGDALFKSLRALTKEDRRKLEKEKQEKAESARREKEEKEAEKKAEEERKKKEMAEWLAEADKIKEKRESEKKKGYDKIDAETKKKKEELLKQKNTMIESIKGEIKSNQENMEMHKQELLTLGVFKIARKKELIKMIMEEEERERNLLEDIEKKNSQNDKDIVNTDKKAQEKKTELECEIDKRYPIPESPEQRQKREAKERKKAAFFEGHEGEVRRQILDFLSEGGARLISEIQSQGYGLGSYSNQKIAHHVKELEKEGYVEKAVVQGKSYFARTKKNY